MANTCKERRRAYEDKVLGPNVTRIEGKYEVGVGSRYAGLPEQHKATLAALDELCAADEAMSAAASALAAAEARMSDAQAMADTLNPQPVVKQKSKPVIVQPDGSWTAQ